MLKHPLILKFECVSQEGDSEERKREKQEKVNKMESLAKELDELLKQDGNVVFFVYFHFVVSHSLKYSLHLNTFLLHLQDWVL